jgi:hypothetical protein
VYGDFEYASNLSRVIYLAYLALFDVVSVGNAETGRKFSAFFVRQRALMHSFGLLFLFLIVSI